VPFIACLVHRSDPNRLSSEDKLVPQGRDLVAKLPILVRTETHNFEAGWGSGKGCGAHGGQKKYVSAARIAW